MKGVFVFVTRERRSGLLNSTLLVMIWNKIPAEPSKGRVIFIGARLAGLAAARKLMSFGFEVRTADLGGIVLTGTLGNPPGLLSLQLSYTLHNYTTIVGRPLLLALVTGEVAHKFELTAPTDAVIQLLQILEGIYETQGINVPQPIRSALVPITMMLWKLWGKEDFSLRYPATMHVAFLTGLREAAKMADHASVTTLHLKVEMKKPR
ncbi:hypothetical protein H5410_051469 [Solanum commersonii]|uniref:Uncharacterized protein n=1 Tax=Solanum commersonii TaxID=4109 RepID=A0A9J5WYI3_SOLCO|nr:hypothetical protein H5410_051469 [Solanum commersonii]